MADNRSAKNYFAHGGNDLIIGGRLTFLPGATVEGGEGLFDIPCRDCMILPDVPDSEATTVASLREDFNNLLAVLRRADILASPTDEGGDG